MFKWLQLMCSGRFLNVNSPVLIDKVGMSSKSCNPPLFIISCLASGNSFQDFIAHTSPSIQAMHLCMIEHPWDMDNLVWIRWYEHVKLWAVSCGLAWAVTLKITSKRLIFWWLFIWTNKFHCFYQYQLSEIVFSSNKMNHSSLTREHLLGVTAISTFCNLSLI